MTDDKPARRGAMRVDTDLVRELAALLDETGLTEIEVEDDDRKIRIARNMTIAAASTAMAAPAPSMSASAPTPAAPPADHPGTVKSPMVGTTYLSPEQGAAAFVSIGETVAAGDTLVIIEAMKVMNPIEAPRAGKVVAILVQDGQPVEFDQPLAIVE